MQFYIYLYIFELFPLIILHRFLDTILLVFSVGCFIITIVVLITSSETEKDSTKMKKEFLLLILKVFKTKIRFEKFHMGGLISFRVVLLPLHLHLK